MFNSWDSAKRLSTNGAQEFVSYLKHVSSKIALCFYVVAYRRVVNYFESDCRRSNRVLLASLVEEIFQIFQILQNLFIIYLFDLFRFVEFLLEEHSFFL